MIKGEQKKGVNKKTEKKTEIGVTLRSLQNSKSDEHHERSQIFIKSSLKKYLFLGDGEGGGISSRSSGDEEKQWR